MSIEWKEYEEWILKLLGFRKKNMTKLMDWLHTHPFVWLESMPMDHNRNNDGLNLREDYEDINGILVLDEECMLNDCQCSILEMLAGLAIRIDREYIGSPGECKPNAIFMEMLNNLDLLRYNDRKFHKDAVEKIVLRWLSRNFDRNGSGSIFPLKRSDIDQRDCQIWSQMQAYISEKYC